MASAKNKNSSYIFGHFQIRFNCGKQWNLGGNSQNFLGKLIRLFVTLRCFYGIQVVMDRYRDRYRNRYFMIYTVVNITL